MWQSIGKGALCLAVGVAAGYTTYKAYKSLAKLVEARKTTQDLIQDTRDLINEVDAEAQKLRNQDIEETKRWQKKSADVREHLNGILKDTEQKEAELAQLKQDLADGKIDTLEYAQRLLALSAV